MRIDYWPTLLATAYLVYRLLGVLAAAHAILKVRSVQSSIAWAFTLALFPMVGLPLYFLLGSRKFKGYVQARQRGKLAIQQVAKKLATKIRPYMLPKTEIPSHLRVFQNLVNLPFTKCNGTELLINGKATYDSMKMGIDAAESYILFQFFIIENNKTGHEFKQKLMARARAGIRVYFMIDPLGSARISADFHADLKSAGVHVQVFNSPKWRNRFRLNFRNHRKIIVIDGRSAWVGGLNIGDSYLGYGPRFDYWRDTHLKVTGPLVLPIQLTFLEDWYWASRTIPELYWEPTPAENENRKAMVIPTGPNDYLDHCELFFLQLIHHAQHRLWITSPYFVPNDTVMSALQLAAIRGVDVRIMIPQHPDHFLVYLSGFSFLREAEKAGVKIYRYKLGFLHQKVMLVDDEQAVIGTANLDNRSMRINFEVSILINDREFTQQLLDILRADFNQCYLVQGDELMNKPIWFRLASRIARLLSPLQ